MPDTGATAPAPAPPATDWRRLAVAHWPLWLGMAAMGLPTLLALAQGPWQEESGVHGIIVLVTGLWLVWRRQDEIMAARQEGNPWITAAMLAVALPLYIAGRAFEFVA